MKLVFRNKSAFNFASHKLSYDFICKGSAAEKVSKLFQRQNKKISYSKLFIKSSEIKHQSNLAILSQSQLKLINIDRKAHTKLRNQVHKIDPQQSTLIMKNGQQIQFKHLIFSGDDHEWKNIEHIEGLKSALQTPFTSTYADYPGSSVRELYGKISNDIYFSIPKGIHFGYDNYFMIHLNQSLRKANRESGYNRTNKVRIKILNQGNTLVPFNEQINGQIQNLLTQNKIQLMNNYKVSRIDHRKREFITQSNNAVKYGAFYQYLPLKVPDMLVEAGIDPFNMQASSLVHKNFPNIHIIGNVVPTVFSFYGIHYICNSIAKDIFNSQIKSNKITLYKGDTAFPFWTGQNSLRYFSMNYTKTKFLNNLGKNKAIGRILGQDRNLMGRFQAESYYNGNSYGMPYYICPPTFRPLERSLTTTNSQHKLNIM